MSGSSKDQGHALLRTRSQADLITRAREGEYTHVSSALEQASSKVFRDALKDVSFRSRIGLVAIDECHVVKQWRDFRLGFTILDELRIILHQDVVWFGYSATLDNEVERLVLSSTGFRVVGPNMY